MEAEREKILVVDDEEHIVELVELYLGKEGYKVLRAFDGDTAIEMFAAEKPDLLVLDIMLPGKDGLDVLREIRKNSQTPVIMLTAREAEIDRVVGLELGADDYLTKPFSPRELVARVKAVLRRSKQLDSRDEELLDRAPASPSTRVGGASKSKALATSG